MTTLAAFLLARIAEDEADARSQWSERLPMHTSRCATAEQPPGPFPCDCAGPARLLAECDSKRRIVAMHQGTCDVLAARSTDPDSRKQKLAEAFVESSTEVLQALALPYANHPDYRDDWSPEPDVSISSEFLTKDVVEFDGSLYRSAWPSD